MKILILNGPNINFLGIREPDVYGSKTYSDLVKEVEDYAVDKGIEVTVYQTNHEGGLVDKIQEAYFNKVDGIVFNPGAYTHTSIAILDAVKSVSIPTVEVHLSRVEDREAFRQISYVREACIATVTGKGIDGYLEAIDVLMGHNKK